MRKQVTFYRITGRKTVHISSEFVRECHIRRRIAPNMNLNTLTVKWKSQLVINVLIIPSKKFDQKKIVKIDISLKEKPVFLFESSLSLIKNQHNYKQ